MELICLEPSSQKPLYWQLYTCIKQAIEQNRLQAGEKLPSIRGLSASLAISKITVEKAYQQLLSEGYILNCNRARYLVNNYEIMTVKRPADSRPSDEKKPVCRKLKILHDFASGEMDLAGFDFALWKRYINKVFLDKERLVGYGHVQGEAELRQEIQQYICASRGVTASQEQIVIGPGVQSLLSILCSLLKSRDSRIAFEDPGFKHGRRIFANYAFAIKPIPMEKDGIDIKQLFSSGARLVYVSPSHQFPTGYIMPVGKRVQLLNWAASVKGIIIEDDYDSEFRYFGRPIPALKGLDDDDAVVYVGSLSKVIPPSIRISYMVLPEPLLAAFQQNAGLYNQATSTLEQLALAQFMAEGCLERQIRRLRKLYYGKKERLVNAVRRILGRQVEVEESESGLYIILTVKTGLNTEQLVRRALERGCRVAAVQDYYLQNTQENTARILLYFSKIPADEIDAAVQQLRLAWFD